MLSIMYGRILLCIDIQVNEYTSEIEHFNLKILSPFSIGKYSAEKKWSMDSFSNRPNFEGENLLSGVANSFLYDNGRKYFFVSLSISPFTLTHFNWIDSPTLYEGCSKWIAYFYLETSNFKLAQKYSFHALEVLPMARNAKFQPMYPLLEGVTVRWFGHSNKRPTGHDLLTWVT